MYRKTHTANYCPSIREQVTLERNDSIDSTLLRRALIDNETIDELVILDSTDSTNSDVRRRLESDCAPRWILVVAEEQTAGRGRTGKRWYSSRGGLMFSIGLPLENAAIPPLGMITGIAIARTLEALRLPIMLKWPNDLILEDKKLGGILIETLTLGTQKTNSDRQTAAILGIGINCSNSLHCLPSDVRSTATRLADWPSSSDIDRNALLVSVVNELKRQLAAWSTGLPVLNEFANYCWLTGKNVMWTEGTDHQICGRCLGTTENGHLRIESSQQEFIVASGSVRVL